MPVIEVERVTKLYPARRGRRALTGRGGLASLFQRERPEPVPVLRDVSLQVNAGETLGIIGRNGSGKSTLLKLMAGVSIPSSGVVRVHGRVASLLELGAGFHPMLTGRENIYLNAGLLGMRRESVDRVLDLILDFADIGDAVDQPVDTYSSGMYVRLGFAVAVHSNPDVFLVDEVLAVGDEAFQRKCRRKIGELKEQGKTIVFVSHDLGSVHALCDRVVLLQEGQLLDRGSAQATIDYYLRQTGGDSAVHVMRSGALEAIFSHGRLSLFRSSQELTAPQGIHFSLRSLGSVHSSQEAEWSFEKKSAECLRARGQFLRVPVSMLLELDLSEAGLRVGWSLEVQREAAVEHIGALLPFNQAYTSWYYGDCEGEFPSIAPEQVQPSIIVPPTPQVDQVALMGKSISPVSIRLDDAHPYLMFQVQNSDYMSAARNIYAGLNLPQAESPQTAGLYPMATLHLDLPAQADAIQREFAERRALRRLEAGPLQATLEQGQIRLQHHGLDVTAELHWHTQLRVKGLWLMSHALHWSPITRDGNSLSIAGTSVRMPGRQVWRLWPEKQSFLLEVALELDEALALEEYNVSLVLTPGFTQWRTGREAGSFPEVSPGAQAWTHLNRDYHHCSFIEAAGKELPLVRLQTEGEAQCSMSAINPAYGQHARVLQALHNPGPSGAFFLEPGRHILLTTRVAIKAKSEAEWNAQR